MNEQQTAIIGAEARDLVMTDDPEFDFDPALVVLSDPAGISAESISGLRAHLLAHHVRDKRRSLAVCAPTPGVGCTYVTTNLACSMAATGLRVLLIDANLRTPGVDALIRPRKPGPGLRQCLEGSASLSEAVHDHVLPNLSVMFAGGTAPNAQELIASGELKALFDVCVRDFDLTIVDTPAANSASDARRIASVLRYAMVVLRRNQSYFADARTLVDQLRSDRAAVIGTFLNDY